MFKKGLPPINGLYVTFFVIMTYIFLGSSRNLSVGTFSIIALMVGNAVENGKGVLYQDPAINATQTEISNFISTDSTQAKIMIASCVAFTSAIIHVIYAKLTTIIT